MLLSKRWQAWTYVTFKFERNFHEKYDGMENAEMRLQRAIFMNMTLDSEPDSMLVHLCYRRLVAASRVRDVKRCSLCVCVCVPKLRSTQRSSRLVQDFGSA